MKTTPATTTPGPYLDLDQAVEYCRLKKGTLYNAIYFGKLRKMPGTRKVILKRADLDDYLTRRKRN